MHVKGTDRTIKHDTILLCKSFFEVVRQYFATDPFAKACSGDGPLVCDVFLVKTLMMLKVKTNRCR